MTRIVVLDTEADGLTPTKVHCIVAKEWPSGEETEFVQEECYTDFPEWQASVDKFVCHNGIGYEWAKIFPLLGIDRPIDDIIDSLVLSRLENPMRHDQWGMHSLDAWAGRVDMEKPRHDEWDKYTPEMLVRCREDTRINFAMFRVLLKRMGKHSRESVRLEHDMRWLLDDMATTGFKLDVPKVLALRDEIDTERVKLLREITEHTPPKRIIGGIHTPKYRKTDKLLSLVNQGPMKRWFGRDAEDTIRDVVGGVYTAVEWKPFDPNSPSQVVERMDGWGWKPYIPTKSKKSWKVCEENLATLPDTAPAYAKRIPRYLVACSRIGMIDNWLKNLEADDRVRSRVQSMGAYTHRGSHANPNQANIPSADNKSLWGSECRDCWTVDDPVDEVIRKPDGTYEFKGGGTNVLLGADAAGIQLRIFAHLTGSKEYAKRVLDDPHSANLDALGIPKGPYDEEEKRYPIGRQKAKRFIYAWLLGAGFAKVGEILGITVPKAKTAVAQFIKKTPGLAKLKQRQKDEAERGWMELVDGRWVRVPSAHLAMAIALQGNESSIMKRAMTWWLAECRRRGLRVGLCAWVHDEIQVQVHKDDAVEVGELFCQKLRDVADHYQLKCPMDGDFKLGRTWKETH